MYLQISLYYIASRLKIAKSQTQKHAPVNFHACMDEFNS